MTKEGILISVCMSQVGKPLDMGRQDGTRKQIPAGGVTLMTLKNLLVANAVIALFLGLALILSPVRCAGASRSLRILNVV